MDIMYIFKFNTKIEEDIASDIYAIHNYGDCYKDYCIDYKNRYEESIILEKLFKDVFSCFNKELYLAEEDKNINMYMDIKCEEEYLRIKKYLDDIDRYKIDLKGLQRVELYRWNNHKKLYDLMECISNNKGGESNKTKDDPLFLTKKEIEYIVYKHKEYLYENPYIFRDSDREVCRKSLKDFETILKETNFKRETIFCKYTY